MKTRTDSITKEKADAWDTAMPLLKAMFEEFRELSKKKPESAVSKTKIAVVNRLLIACRAPLKDEASIKFLDLIDEDAVPQMSDVVLTLSQYVAAMEKFYSENYGWDSLRGEKRWFLKAP